VPGSLNVSKEGELAMMSKYTFRDEGHYDYYWQEVQPELDRIKSTFAKSWWMLKTTIFAVLFVVLTLLQALFHIGTIVVALAMSIIALVHGICSGLKLIVKIGRDWLMARPELQSFVR
jgi:uncharacterized membrane protein